MSNAYVPRDYDDHPPFLYADYRSTIGRSPGNDPLRIVQTLSETTGPGPVVSGLTDEDSDLTTNAGTGNAAIGSRIIVTGRVADQSGRAVPGTLIELWQANAAGRYLHPTETDFPAPLDPNFLGVGQCLTDADGRYRFTTIKPGPYPWRNHPNAWRPCHIHFSVMGPALATRLVTQMYFPGDPLLAFDPIFNATPEHARDRLIAGFDPEATVENWAVGYRFDLVLRGPAGSLLEGGETR